MSVPYRILSKRALLNIGASIMMTTGAIGLTSVTVAPTAYAATQQATNLAQFTKLVGYLNQFNAALQNEGSTTYTNVETFADSVFQANDTVWGPVLYGTNYSGSPAQTAAIKFIKDMVSLVLPTPSSGVKYPLKASVAMEHQITSMLNTDLSGYIPTTTLTGTDLYNFYESFRAAIINQLPSVLIHGSAGQSLTQTVLDPALESAVASNPEFKGILGNLGLSVSQIANYRQNFTNTFTSPTYGIGAAAALNDAIEASINPQFNGASITGNTLSMTSGSSGQFTVMPASDTGSTLQTFSIPGSWYTLTSDNPGAVTVSQNPTTKSWTISAVGAGTAHIQLTLRGYQLNQITVNVSSSGSGSTTPPPSSSPTSPTTSVTGVAGQPLAAAVLGNNGTQIQVTVPAEDVTQPIQVNMQALTSLPANVTAIGNVFQAIELSAVLQNGAGSSGTSTPVNYFTKPVTITFTLSGAPTTPLVIVFWNSLTQSWQPISNFSVSQNKITMTTTHFTTFAVVNASSVQSVNRIAGQRALDTSIQAAEAAYPDGASSVVLAFAGHKLPSPDALSAAGLAGALHAPLLLTAQNQLDPAVLKAIQALGAKTVYALGGNQAISDTVVNALTSAGLTVVRSFEGKTLYDTSMMIDQYMYQNKLTSAQTVFIANGQTMIDAVSASPVAYQQGAPIMLVKTGQSQLTASQLAFLQSAGIKNAVVLGGNYVVSTSIESQLTQTLGAANVSRLGGKTMNDTAAAIDQHYFPNASGAVLSSNGSPSGTFVDALSASAFAANNNVPILLTNQNGLPASTAQYLAGQTGLHAIWVMGGPKAVVASLDQTLNGNISTTN